MKNKKGFFYNALLLTAVTLLIRTVGVWFNIYVSGKVGAEAMGLLSLVSGVYNFAVTLATSGIHLATVRIFAERLQKTHGAENRQCLRACLAYAAFFGTLSTMLLFSSSGVIGNILLKEPRSIRPLRTLAFTLLPLALSSVFNGYFTAMRRAYKNAAASVIEQGIKISLTGYLLVIVSPKTVEGSILAVLLGGAVAEALTLFLNIILYLHDRRLFKKIKQQKNAHLPSIKSIALPVAISAYMRSGLLAIEHILIPRGLIKHGAGNSAALASYGALQGMALPVVLYPAAILSSFSALLIPEITAEHQSGNKREISYIIGRVYQTALLFSVGVSGVMLFLCGELGEVLYQSAEVGKLIGALAPLVPIMYLDTATDAILKGMGEQVFSMNINIVDALISVFLVWLLVPHLGIYGYLLTIYISEIFNTACSICRLISISGFQPRVLTLLFRPIAVMLLTALASRFIFLKVLPVTAFSANTLTLHIFVFSLIYVLILIFTKTLPGKDVSWISQTLFGKRNTKKEQSLCKSAPKKGFFARLKP